MIIDEDKAVSPVIGVILMVIIVVILAAVVAAFVFGMASQVPEETNYKTVQVTLLDICYNPITKNYVFNTSCGVYWKEPYFDIFGGKTPYMGVIGNKYIITYNPSTNYIISVNYDTYRLCDTCSC